MMFQNLFSPQKLGKVEVKNRISFQPHLTTLQKNACQVNSTCTTGVSGPRAVRG